MPKQKRHKTDYPGVFYVEGTQPGSGKPENVFYISYRRAGKKIEEKAGRQFKDRMTAARASHIRSARIEGKQLSNQEKREAERAKKKAEQDKWTIDKLWEEYKSTRTDNKSLKTDEGRYKKYLEPVFGNKEPKDILALDVDRLRIKLLKKRSPQTVKHVLNLLTWICNFGVKKGLCQGLSCQITKPTVNNIVTEDLAPDQLARLLEAIDNDDHPQAGPLMKMALYSGMRRGELFKLKWKDVDFERGFIYIRDPKGGPDQKIPLNDETRKLLESHPRNSQFVFPGRQGKQRVDINHQVREIANNAGLPKDFRPVHSLRHTFASMLASSGEVDMYTLQKLLTHKSPIMTQRYAHLRDETLKQASNLAGTIIQDVIRDKPDVIKLKSK